MLLTLDVPASAIRLEALSRNTAENAQQSLGLIQAVDAKRVRPLAAGCGQPGAEHEGTEGVPRAGRPAPARAVGHRPRGWVLPNLVRAAATAGSAPRARCRTARA